MPDCTETERKFLDELIEDAIRVSDIRWEFGTHSRFCQRDFETDIEKVIEGE